MSASAEAQNSQISPDADEDFSLSSEFLSVQFIATTFKTVRAITRSSLAGSINRVCWEKMKSDLKLS